MQQPSTGKRDVQQSGKQAATRPGRKWTTPARSSECFDRPCNPQESRRRPAITNKIAGGCSLGMPVACHGPAENKCNRDEETTCSHTRGQIALLRDGHGNIRAEIEAYPEHEQPCGSQASREYVVQIRRSFTEAATGINDSQSHLRPTERDERCNISTLHHIIPET